MAETEVEHRPASQVVRDLIHAFVKRPVKYHGHVFTKVKVPGEDNIRLEDVIESSAAMRFS